MDKPAKRVQRTEAFESAVRIILEGRMLPICRHNGSWHHVRASSNCWARTNLIDRNSAVLFFSRPKTLYDYAAIHSFSPYLPSVRVSSHHPYLASCFDFAFHNFVDMANLNKNLLNIKLLIQSAMESMILELKTLKRF